MPCTNPVDAPAAKSLSPPPQAALRARCPPRWVPVRLLHCLLISTWIWISTCQMMP